VRKIAVSREYAEFLAGELDSDGYARSLVNRPRRSSAAQAEDELLGLGRVDGCAWAGPVPRTSPEYQRFLHEEISSREYAVSIARYAKLEELFRSPSRLPSLPRGPRRSPLAGMIFAVVQEGLERLHVVFSLSGWLIATLAIVPVLTAAGLDLLPTAIGSAWTISYVGGFLLALTVIAATSSILLGWARSFAGWLDNWQDDRPS
jgi:hypothetical protein